MTDDAHQRQALRAAELTERGQLTLRSEREGQTHTICLFGELDLATADDVQAELERVESTDAEEIVLDLSGLKFMDSTGVRLIVNAHARARADGIRLTLLRGRPAVQRVMELSGIDVLLPFTD